MTRRVDPVAAELNAFADALRECLGLEPLHRKGVEPRGYQALEEREARRFYREPFVWGEAQGKRGVR